MTLSNLFSSIGGGRRLLPKAIVRLAFFFHLVWLTARPLTRSRRGAPAPPTLPAKEREGFGVVGGGWGGGGGGRGGCVWDGSEGENPRLLAFTAIDSSVRCAESRGQLRLLAQSPRGHGQLLVIASSRAVLKLAHASLHCSFREN